MFSMAEKLIKAGYRPLINTDDFDSITLKTLPETIGYSVPDDYLQFVIDFPNTGIFDDDVLCSGIDPAPCAPDRLYPITLLYASCSTDYCDLLKLRDIQCEIPQHFLIIGNDDSGNYFCLDLREESLGNVYFLFHEEEIETGLYLLANDFTSFIGSLRRQA